MGAFGKTSKARLATCDERLQRVFNRVNERFPCTVICGERGEVDQNTAFDAGRSKLRYPEGKHNKPKGAVKAVDVMPDPVCWDETPKNIEQLGFFAGYVLGVAAEMGITLRWGHDWDGDMQPDIKGLVDRPHYEIVEKENKMTVNKNIVTNVVGVIGAVAGAAEPIISATAGNSLDTKGITQLVLSICFAVVAFFTGRPQAQ